MITQAFQMSHSGESIHSQIAALPFSLHRIRGHHLFKATKTSFGNPPPPTLSLSGSRELWVKEPLGRLPTGVESAKPHNPLRCTLVRGPPHFDQGVRHITERRATRRGEKKRSEKKRGEKGEQYPRTLRKSPLLAIDHRA